MLIAGASHIHAQHMNDECTEAIVVEPNSNGTIVGDTTGARYSFELFIIILKR